MTRSKNEPEFLGAHEAAQLLGVRQSNLRKLVGLPTPYQDLLMGSLWKRSDIEDFKEALRERRAA
jgi:hypothetical protein